MKVLLKIIGAILLFVSCNDESQEQTPDCSNYQRGNMYVKFGEVSGQEVDYNDIFFTIESDTLLSLNCLYFTDLCEWRVSHTFLVKRNLLMQSLVNRQSIDGNRVIGSTYFRTLDHDATTEGFGLYDGESAWFQFTQLSDTEVRGRFQATYIHEPGFIRAWNLPDTLRFNNIEFVANLYIRPED